jgi:putative hemolysin
MVSLGILRLVKKLRIVWRRQVIAAGARYGPSPFEIEELNKSVFSHRTAVARRNTSSKYRPGGEEEDDTAKPKSGHAVVEKK